MDQTDNFINAENILRALIKPRKTTLEQADRKAKTSGKAKAPGEDKEGVTRQQGGKHPFQGV